MNNVAHAANCRHAAIGGHAFQMQRCMLSWVDALSEQHVAESRLFRSFIKTTWRPLVLTPRPGLPEKGRIRSGKPCSSCLHAEAPASAVPQFKPCRASIFRGRCRPAVRRCDCM
eukprot:scaffold67258_cov17-Tisochrysis_lutea.AAC.1